ncbi:MAG TPA: diacylglycerol kinase family protein [Anaerolineales bacterium]|nr:diacylglycerol kinase family protein [Anaerolineales bacterium]
MKEIEAKKPPYTNKHHMRAKLIFNPGSGTTDESPVQLMDVIGEMQAWKLVPEAYLVEPDSDLSTEVQNAVEDGIRMFVVCGGDGTIDVVARAMAGTNTTLGIIPTGTQNNVALSLGIPPADIPAAIAILRNGKRIKVDMGQADFGKAKQSFLEVCSVGLASSLFSSADDIQHGDLTRVGDFLATLVSSAPAEMHLTLDGKREITTRCHAILVSNTPYIGPHFQVGTPDSMDDGLLDVLLFANLSKMDLISYAVQAAIPGGGPEDERIQHYHVHRIDIVTHPAMPVMVDGLVLGEGPLRISMQRHVLAVMVGKAPTNGHTQR